MKIKKYLTPILSSLVLLSTGFNLSGFAAAKTITTNNSKLSLTQPKNNTQISFQTLTTIGTFLPSIISTLLTNNNTKNSKELAKNIQQELNLLNLSPELKNIVDQLIQKLTTPNSIIKTTNEQPKIPDPNAPGAPVIQEFLYPTLALRCNNDGGFFSLVKVLTTAGPQAAPAPGPAEGQAGFVATILGTGPAINNPENPLLITWTNLTTRQKGTVVLNRNEKINPDGPATYTAIAATGKGKILAIISGNVTTKTTEGENKSCPIIPTIGIAEI